MQTPFTIASVIFFLGVLIFVHEMGHFLVAKYFDVKVLKFSLGFGPPILTFALGETTYQIALIPLGGYVRMAGENPLEEVPQEDKARAFNTAPIYQRALIAIAGPAANLILPVICFFSYNLLGPEVLAPVVGQVEEGEVADLSGVKPGDRILAVNGERTWSFERVQRLVSQRPNEKIVLRVLRDDKEIDLYAVPKPAIARDHFGAKETVGRISVSAIGTGSRVGVEYPDRNEFGFKTGDVVVDIAGTKGRAH